MNGSIIVILVMLVLSVLSVGGDVFLKRAGTGVFSISWFAIGFFLYVLAIIGWFFVFKHVKLSTVGVYSSLFSLLLLVAVGVFYFKEHLSGQEIAGIILAIISIVLLAGFA